MNITLVKVADFHRLFDHPIGESPDAQEALQIRQLRIKLLFEELTELAEAGDVARTLHELAVQLVDKNWSTFEVPDGELSTKLGLADGDDVDKKEELDALCDLQYVLNGKILTAGLLTVFTENFMRVHNNNMKKAHISIEHAEETVRKLGGKPEDYKIFEKTIAGEGEELHYFILTRTDGKVVKPWDHKKVELQLDL